jgi:UDP-4-amino-4,6-dideoxy-N-acetyl-beta-L-altrosamine N-acetyltransferase
MMDISSDKVLLRQMNISDLVRVLEWRNHPKVRLNMFNQMEINSQDHSIWYEQVSKDSSRILLIMEVNNQPLGYINFDLQKDKFAEWGFYTAPNAPKGTGKLLGKTAIDYGFKHLKLNGIIGKVLQNNLTSQNFHLRFGFLLDSLEQSEKVDTGKQPKIYKYLLTRENWDSLRGKSNE